MSKHSYKYRLTIHFKAFYRFRDNRNLVGSKVDRLEIAWINAYVGHTGNERADLLAREEQNTNKIMKPFFCKGALF